ncbi:MAG: 23S rRNA pseudouridine(955/2504/2580) synthase RluC [Arsenophonus sp. NC-PE1-MAG3]
MKIHNQVQFITIDNDKAGQRIDNFLLRRLKSVPKRRIYRILRKGEVRINSSRIKPEYKIQTSDLIRIPPIRLAKKQQYIISNKLNKITELINYILYEDKYLLVLNKPSGMAVHGGSGINFGVIEALRTLRPEAPFLELVHRLDRETSGVLLIAKKSSALKELHKQLRLKQMKKQYLALVKGQWPSHMKVIQSFLLKNILQSGKRTVKVGIDGKYSETHFKIEESFSNTTLVNAKPITGRTHQIRVHAQYAKHPIVYDSHYGDRDFNQQLTFTGLKRLFLHASSLMFIHPASREKLTFNAPLDQQLKSCLAKLRKQ